MVYECISLKTYFNRYTDRYIVRFDNGKLKVIDVKTCKIYTL